MKSLPVTKSQPISQSLATSWNTHVQAINFLGEEILASGWKPTAILGISRGGLIPATMLSYILDVRVIQTIRVQHYDEKNNPLDSGPQFVAGPEPFASRHIETDRLLVVDDIIDTGETLKLVLDAVRPQATEVKVAALYVRSNRKDATNWFWRVEDQWVIFPWAPEC